MIAGDIGTNEVLILAPPDADGAAENIKRDALQAGARIVHYYGPRVMIAVVPDEQTEGLRKAAGAARVIATADELASLGTEDLDPTGALGLAAFRLRVSP